MSKVEQIIRQYLPKVKIMQLATCVNNQPWQCTVHYYSDDDLNFYWISTPTRRHSVEIAQNPKVSGYVLLHENTPEEVYVIGLAFEATAELIGKDIDSVIGQNYVDKHAKDPNLIEDIKSGKNHHQFYKLTPTNFVLFDSKDFSDNPRQEWSRK